MARKRRAAKRRSHSVRVARRKFPRPEIDPVLIEEFEAGLARAIRRGRRRTR